MYSTYIYTHGWAAIVRVVAITGRVLSQPRSRRGSRPNETKLSAGSAAAHPTQRLEHTYTRTYTYPADRKNRENKK